ncbi:MAG: NAD(+) synthase [Candidatus Hodarchaeota archaeon]
MANLDISGRENEIIKNITAFIDTQTTKRGVDGVLILFSGYIDSTIVAKLALDALAENSVKLLVRHGKFNRGNQEEILSSSIEYLGIDRELIIQHDIEPMIEQLKSGIYTSGSIREIPTIYEPLSYNLLKITAKEEILEKTYGMIGTADTEREKLIHKIVALNKVRSRIHMAIAYFTAEQENRFFLGTVNKTELLTGLFTKWGHGHCADLMPLGDLYRSQIIQLAKKLNIPRSIRNSAKADLLPGIDNKYLYFFNLKSSDVDSILIGLEDDLSAKEISKTNDLDIEAVKKVKFFYDSTIFTRSTPLIPKIW